MRAMALDVGDRRIGVALSDESRFLATPHSTIDRTEWAEDIEAILRLARDNDVGEIVAGLPRSLSGEIGKQARVTARFIKDLTARSPAKVITVDERYSSVEAQRIMRSEGAQPSRDKAHIDAVAASVLLQSYLDASR